MHSLAHKKDERVEAVYFARDSLIVDLMDGRTISVFLSWYPRLLKATPKERANWEIGGGGYGIHWPDVDEDLSTEGLLRGAPSPEVNKMSAAPKRLSKRRQIKKSAKSNGSK